MKLKWIILIVVVLVIAAGVVWQKTRPEAELEVISPDTGTIRAFVEEQAKTELPRDYLIAMPISGWLDPITLREDDAITQGQVLATLDKADLQDRVQQARNRIAVLKTKIEQTNDHRLEDNAKVEIDATVIAINKTVEAGEAKLKAAKAVADFAKSELERVSGLADVNVAADRELREVETTWRRADAEYQSDALELAALKTLQAVSYIGPKFITDYVDRKKFDRDSYRQQLAEAEAALAIEQRNLERAEMTSPIDGVVLERFQTRRQYLAAGTPLLTVGKLDDIEVIAEVLTERATRIRRGTPVEVYGEAIIDGPVAGEVTRVYPAGFKKISSLGVEQQRVKVAIQLDRRPARLGVGYRVQVRIYYDEANDAMTLPRTALFRDKRGNWQVMVVEEGRTRLRTVEVGLMNDDQAEILSGLTEYDRIVAKPSRDVNEDMRVTIRQDEGR
jgi:HlyD family secretion protein